MTPFTDDMSSVGEVRLARIVRSLLPLNPAGFLICGDLGEFSVLSLSERKSVLEIISRETGNAVPILVNATSVGTMPTLDLAQHAKRHGARAVVLMPPYYGQFTSGEMLHHIKVVANHSDLVVMVVDPQRRLDDEVREELRNHGGVRFPDPIATIIPPSCAVAETSTTDEFSCDGIVCSPLAMFDLSSFRDVVAGGQSVKIEALATAMRSHGKVRIAKGLLQYRELEAGPPRNPMQMAALDVIRELDSTLQKS